MNIALEETQEVVEGVPRGKYGDAFIRGNNGESGVRLITHTSVTLTATTCFSPLYHREGVVACS